MTLYRFDALLPTEDSFLEKEKIFADKTYGLHLEKGCIEGFVERVESIKQSIFKILRTEKEVFPIYSVEYGVAFDDLTGEHFSVVQSELKRRIFQALTWDSRIIDVTDFSFSKKRDVLDIHFVAKTQSERIPIDWRMKGL